MTFPAAKIAISLAILLSVASCTVGEGCPEPTPVEGGRYEFGAGSTPGADGLFPRNSFVAVICFKGYKLKGGSSVIYCNDDDEWSASPTCRAENSCQSPNVLHGANWTLVESDRRSRHDDASFIPNTKINVACWPGFVSIESPSQITCGMSGEWSPSIPTCREVMCPSLLESEAEISHLQSNMANRTYRLGEVVDYRCDAGYRILGKTWRECSGPSLHHPNRTWSDLDPICSEIECPDPGHIQFEGSRYLDSRRVGGNVTFRCRSGFNLQGSRVRHCLPNGKWSGALTTCDHEDFYCPNPGIPIGGRMVNEQSVQFRKGNRVLYECNRDRVLLGSDERECLKSRSWSGEPPTCRGPFDFEDTVEVAARMGYNIEGLVTKPQTPTEDNNTTGPSGRFISLGYTRGMDIYFVFDASGSIPKAHFQYGLDLAKALVSKIGVADGPRQARYGACLFASDVQVAFHVSDPQPSVGIVNGLLDGLINLHGTDPIGRGTATGKALKLIHENMIPAAYDRPNAHKYLFLFTDGKTNMGADVALPKKEAETLRERFKVQIHCIGVGHEIDINELQEIASQPTNEHLFLVKDYGELHLLVQTITKQKLDYSPCGYNGGPNHLLTPRIAGGNVAENGEWPWQVALFCDKGIAGCDECVPEFFCGGSLIARNWVLSAAHCFRECPWSDIRVYTGILDKSTNLLREFDPSLVYNLDGEDALIRHEEYNDQSLDNDIALLRLSRNATLSPNVRPICMPQPTMQDAVIYSQNGDAFVAGWGTTDPYELDNCKDTPLRTSPLLKQLAVTVRTDEECRNSFTNHFKCSIVTAYKPDIAFCAGDPEGNQDACRGDSGGPVMRQMTVADGSKRWVQIGIVSWGEGCAQKGRYGIYTRLSTYKDWIQDHIGSTAYAIHN
ncbi:complement C2-like isoform X2 [Patiria miniata]|uniref:C3/C5 convertase n=1 Tax=Patiria miniata TaxID=46514 RepID=A0A913Z639_PATMI|nr:complement C2-like isoform X2 [Patiria miniata]